MGYQLGVMPLPTQKNTTQKSEGTLNAPSGIRTRDPSVQVVEDSTCLKQCGHWGPASIVLQTSGHNI